MKSHVGTWSVALGLTGFLCGFAGPIVLQPDSNQGPLLGIFITGPGGLLLGAVVGAILGLLKVRPEVSKRWLAGTCAVGTAAILFACLPKPEHEATLLDVEVRGCVPALDWTGRAFENWEKRLQSITWATPPADWREHFQRTAVGSVVTVTTRRRCDILRSQRPWNKGDRSASGWEPGPGRAFMRPNDFYVSGSCVAFPRGTTGVYLAKPAEGDSSYPPRDPSSFLDMVVLEPMPASLAEYGR